MKNMVKRYREYAYVKKKKKHRLNKKKLKKRSRQTIDAGVRIWNKMNSKNNRKALGKMGKSATKISDNLRDII
jgi:hypothetical protein